MSTEAISAATFIREYTRELHNKNAAVFAGAGLSVASGYVDWAGLLAEIIQDLGLDPSKNHDLVGRAVSLQPSGREQGETHADYFQSLRSPGPGSVPSTNNFPFLTWANRAFKMAISVFRRSRKVPGATGLAASATADGTEWKEGSALGAACTFPALLTSCSLAYEPVFSKAGVSGVFRAFSMATIKASSFAGLFKAASTILGAVPEQEFSRKATWSSIACHSKPYRLGSYRAAIG